MNCPRCNAPIKMQMNRCGQCGQPISVYKKVIRISNTLYNIGLEKARIRDLSGTISVLNMCLKYNKQNVDARNLLGLVYYEIGETVSALTEWILSKNIRPDDNEAGYYIDSIQSNPIQLDTVNQTIKKYNSALVSARQGSEDLSVIQLKKVVNLNPNFVKAQQLLALLYIKTGEKSLALRCLNRIKAVDINNTTTIRYMHELGAVSNFGESTAAVTVTPERKVFKGDSNVAVKPVGSYKPQKARAFPFINVMIGVFIGLVVSFVLISPSILKNISHKESSEVIDYGTKLAAKDSEIESLKYDKENLTNQVKKVEQQLVEASQDDSLSAAEVYDKILTAYKDYTDGKVSDALAGLTNIDMTKVDSEAAKEIVKKIQDQDKGKASAEVFEKGRVAYNGAKYDEALEYLNQAIELNPDNFDAIYFLGRLYHKQGDKEKAEEYYQKIISDYPDSPRVTETKQKLNELGINTDSE